MGKYSSGGFFFDFVPYSTNRTAYRENITKIFNEGYLDESTRGLVIKATLYNMDYDYFISIFIVPNFTLNSSVAY